MTFRLNCVIGNNMQTDFKTNYEIDRLVDEALIDYLFPEDVVNIFYQDDIQPLFEEGLIDFGGGIFGITCRSVISTTGGDPDVLLKLLKLRRTNENKAMCGLIINECKRELNSAAYLT